MSPSATVLLTDPRADLLDALAVRRPDLRALPLSADIPREPLDGPVIAFIDWLLPDISGLELCRRLRLAPNTSHARLTLVLEPGDYEARRRALRSGADDYISSPLTADALLARIDLGIPDKIDARVRPRLRHGDLEIDLEAHQARYGPRLIRLGSNEFRLLVHLVEHPHQVFSRSALIERLGKPVQGLSQRTVDVWVSRIRCALRDAGAPDPLRAVSKYGYVLDAFPVQE
jgi:two-component system phosphate regulon response regulator PhoB